MTDELILVPRRELLAWAKEWQAENDPGDDADCVTPFDKHLYAASGEEVLRADLLYYIAKCGDIYVNGSEAGGSKWIAVQRRELAGLDAGTREKPAESQAQGGGEFDYIDIANRAQESTGRSIWPSTAKAVLNAAQGCGEVVAWMRRWEFDNVDVMALPREERPSGWYLRPVTPIKILDDDVPLYTAPPSALAQQQENGHD